MTPIGSVIDPAAQFVQFIPCTIHTHAQEARSKRDLRGLHEDHINRISHIFSLGDTRNFFFFTGTSGTPRVFHLYIFREFPIPTRKSVLIRRFTRPRRCPPPIMTVMTGSRLFQKKSWGFYLFFFYLILLLASFLSWNKLDLTTTCVHTTRFWEEMKKKKNYKHVILVRTQINNEA